MVVVGDDDEDDEVELATLLAAELVLLPLRERLANGGKHDSIFLLLSRVITCLQTLESLRGKWAGRNHLYFIYDWGRSSIT